MSDNKCLDTVPMPLQEPNIFKKPKVHFINDMAKQFTATFEVHKDKNGYLCASDMQQGIFTDGKDKEDLIKNIREAVECHFDVPYQNVDIKIKGISE